MISLRRLFSKREDRVAGDPVDLVAEYIMDPRTSPADVYTVWYGIYLHDSMVRVGYADLRVGKSEELYYAGNVGYRISPFYRGHSYAYEACRMILEIARDTYDMEEVIITVSPDNPASCRTLDKLGGELIETTDVPAWHWLYRRGEKVKRIYRFTLR